MKEKVTEIRIHVRFQKKIDYEIPLNGRSLYNLTLYLAAFGTDVSFLKEQSAFEPPPSTMEQSQCGKHTNPASLLMIISDIRNVT